LQGEKSPVNAFEMPRNASSRPSKGPAALIMAVNGDCLIVGIVAANFVKDGLKPSGEPDKAGGGGNKLLALRRSADTSPRGRRHGAVRCDACG
jgi:hypothetical protein